MDKTDYGEVEYQGKEYTLAEQATLSNRMFPGWFGDAEEGEPYTAEYQAAAVDNGGESYMVLWHFETVRGEEPWDESDYPFDNDHVWSVEAQ